MKNAKRMIKNSHKYDVIDVNVNTAVQLCKTIVLDTKPVVLKTAVTLKCSNTKQLSKYLVLSFCASLFR